MTNICSSHQHHHHHESFILTMLRSATWIFFPLWSIPSKILILVEKKRDKENKELSRTQVAATKRIWIQMGKKNVLRIKVKNRNPKSLNNEWGLPSTAPRKSKIILSHAISNRMPLETPNDWSNTVARTSQKTPNKYRKWKTKKQQRFTEKASCNITSPPAFRLTNKRKKNLFSSLIACVCLKIQQRRSEQWRSRERGTSALASNNCSCTSCCSSRRRRL